VTALIFCERVHAGPLTDAVTGGASILYSAPLPDRSINLKDALVTQRPEGYQQQPVQQRTDY
jgi:hypothetical protein